MDPLLKTTLVKVAAPSIGLALMLLVGPRSGLPLREHFGFQAPRAAAAIAFFTLWIALVAIEEVVGGMSATLRGATAATPWADYPATIVLLRILAIGVLGPIAEETAFRGLLLGALWRVKTLNPYAAIAITSLCWTALHVQYDATTLCFVFVDGLVLGLARWKTKSLWVPICMHIVGNGYSIYQSLHG